MNNQRVISFIKYLGIATLNSYSMLLFSKNRLFALLILLVSFFTPFTGACGLAALLTALVAASALGFGKEQLQQGLLTYSVVLFGLGFGTNFEFGTAFCLLLFIGALLTLFLSVALNAILNKKGLPALSLAFIISTNILIIASKSFEGIGLTHRHIYWYNDMYALGGTRLVNLIQQIENWNIPDYIAGFFRSMSAILFQVNIASGILLAAGVLIFSRIGFMLMVLGYTIALLFNNAMGGFHQSDMTYYNMGTNFMLVAMALGGFYIIPSIRSFLWLFITIPVAYLLVVSLGSFTFSMGILIFSLPFCLVVMLFLYMLQLRTTTQSLVTTPVQYYSPEQNLYRYLNGKERLMNKLYFHLYLPVMGEWMVSQGHDGHLTHKGEWSKAWDFVVLDNEMKTFALPGNQPENFYCYNKPVLAPADGIVEEIIDHVEDNEIGANNTAQNWGNSIVIKHSPGLYTKLSHLRKNSCRVTKGRFVKRGEVIAACGNSGRSPEPHLHMQVQSTPYVGSKTLSYPLAYYKSRLQQESNLKSFSSPAEGSFVSNIAVDSRLPQAFNFQPGYCLEAAADGFATEEWETCTSIYNECYLYCKQHNASAYFIYDGTMFHFTNYFGPCHTLLYQFYLAAYSVPMSTASFIRIKNNYPANIIASNSIKWLQDIFAPFYIFMQMKYYAELVAPQDVLTGGDIIVKATQTLQIAGHKKTLRQFETTVQNGSIAAITVTENNRQIKIICRAKN